ncbi:uncharacterized protein LOC109800474 [Cajanus cajan]|uniref:uncharacterized protein LOC109800474 n=1 Tax=Cajanus cajan TaxID=3821 RepID=UPI00098D92CB|nr:uncharacterized protein LOC109800474 [Cajanus cajan]
MQKQNPSESSPSSDDTRTHNPQGGEGEIMKTPWQVLEELCGGDSESGCSDSKCGGSSSGGVPVVVTVVVSGGGGGGSSSSVVVTPVSEGVQAKGRGTSEVRDPCPVCNKDFTTWKGAFGHMHAHPNCDYNGFFKSRVFASSSQYQPPSDNNKSDGAKKSSTTSNSTNEVDNSGEKRLISSPNQVLDFDLNESMEEAVKSSHIAKESVRKEKDLGFDLNQMPPADHYEG